MDEEHIKQFRYDINVGLQKIWIYEQWFSHQTINEQAVLLYKNIVTIIIKQIAQYMDDYINGIKQCVDQQQSEHNESVLRDGVCQLMMI